MCGSDVDTARANLTTKIGEIAHKEMQITVMSNEIATLETRQRILVRRTDDGPCTH